MKRPSSYNTKKKEALIAYFTSLKDEHVTAAGIMEHFASKGTPINRTTLYRLLDKLVESGELGKYSIDGMTGSCFQYVSKGATCKDHFHMKCESCGELYHLDCGALDGVKSHVLSEHDFEIDTVKSVLYGICLECTKKTQIDYTRLSLR